MTDLSPASRGAPIARTRFSDEDAKAIAAAYRLLRDIVARAEREAAESSSAPHGLATDAGDAGRRTPVAHGAAMSSR